MATNPLAKLLRKKGRSTTELELNPEITQPLSSDFNLYYKPEAEPLPSGMKEFVEAVGNFAEGGATKGYLASEYKDKEINIAKAEKEFRKNKKKFRDAVKDGLIDKTANPYYLEHYKKMTLNEYATKFADLLSKSYIDNDVLNDTRDGAFTNWYKAQMDAFIKKHDLGYFSDLELENGFFKETSSNRSIIENNHRQQQQVLFQKKFDEKVVNNVYGVLSKYKLYDRMTLNFNDTVQYIAKDLNAVIQGLVDLDDDGGRAIDLAFKGIEAYIKKTRDYDYAKKLITALPKLIKGGTGSAGDIGRIKKKQEELLTLLHQSQGNKQSLEIEAQKTKSDLEAVNTYKFLDTTINDSNFDWLEWYNDPKRTNQERLTGARWKKDQKFDGGKSNHPNSEAQIYNYLEDGNYELASAYARDEMRAGNITKAFYTTLITTLVPNHRSHKNKPIFGNPIYKRRIDALKQYASQVLVGGDKLQATNLINLLETQQLEWYNDNIKNKKYYNENNEFNNSLFRKDFLAEFENNFAIARSLKIGDKTVFSSLKWEKSKSFSTIEELFKQKKKEPTIPK